MRAYDPKCLVLRLVLAAGSVVVGGCLPAVGDTGAGGDDDTGARGDDDNGKGDDDTRNDDDDNGNDDDDNGNDDDDNGKGDDDNGNDDDDNGNDDDTRNGDDDDTRNGDDTSNDDDDNGSGDDDNGSGDDDTSNDDDDTSAGGVTAGYPAGSGNFPPSTGGCGFDSTELLSICDYQFALSSAPVEGEFLTFGNGTERFRTVTGQVLELDVEGTADGLALLPDLTAWGTVRVGHVGGCDGKGGPGGTFYVEAATPPHPLLLAVGASTSFARGTWTVSSPRDIASCAALPDRAGCTLLRHPKPVAFSDGVATITLLQGETAGIGGLQAAVLQATSAEQYACTDGPGTELQRWILAPVP